MNNIIESFSDYPDNSSIAVSVYIPGCDLNCEGCQNKDLQKYQNFDEDVFLKDIEIYLKRSKTDKLCLLGGDPLSLKNINITKKILDKFYKEYNICIYTGNDIEYVKKMINLNLLNNSKFTFIKTGKFDNRLYQKPEKNDIMMILASKNQQIYDNKLNLLSKDGIFIFKDEEIIQCNKN